MIVAEMFEDGRPGLIVLIDITVTSDVHRTVILFLDIVKNDLKFSKSRNKLSLFSTCGKIDSNVGCLSEAWYR